MRGVQLPLQRIRFPFVGEPGPFGQIAQRPRVQLEPGIALPARVAVTGPAWSASRKASWRSGRS